MDLMRNPVLQLKVSTFVAKSQVDTLSIKLTELSRIKFSPFSDARSNKQWNMSG